MNRLLSVGALALLVAAGAAPDERQVAQTQRLGGAIRVLTHVSTDKPVYKIGETVLVRGVVLGAANRRPQANTGYAVVSIKGPKGNVVASAQVPVTDGSFGFPWEVPEGTAGGEFTVVGQGTVGSAPGERKFDVRVYRAPRLKNQIVFARDGYGAGDTVTATLETIRAEGGVPTGAKITAVARVDGVDVATAPCALDAKGTCTVSLKLPAAIERGEGTIAFTIADGGVVETATKTIPLLVTSFDIALYPEGGELVAGLPGRLYLEARTLAQKPADIAGVIVDSKGAEVSSFRTEHEGRGRFAFTPTKGEAYTLRVTQPASVKKTVKLPAVQASGVAIASSSETVGANQPVKLTIGLNGPKSATVTLRQREVVLSKATVSGAGGPVTLEAKDADGVLMVTVTDAEGKPLAERLVFRESAKQLTIKLEADRERYTPGAPVSLKVITSVDGKPTAAIVGLTVTDDSVQELIEKREQAPMLPAMVLLEDDVRELADAHVYLDAANPKARLAADLLLGTQGWRRFALVDLEQFLSREQDEARRAFAFTEPPPEYEMMGALFGAAGMGEAAAARGAPKGGAAQMPMAPMPPGAAAPREKAVNRPVGAEQDKEVPAQNQLHQNGALRPVAEPVVKQEQRVDELKRKVRDPGPPRDSAIGSRGRIAMNDEIGTQPMAVVGIREYAHRVRPGRKANDRLDFSETLYWSAATKTNEKGEAVVTFGTSDAVTAFRTQASGYTTGGVLGAGQIKIESVKPFYVEPKLPLEVTEGDLIRLPVAFINGTREGLTGVSLTMSTKADLRFTSPGGFALKADERGRRVVDITVGPKSRTTELTLNATAGGYSDVVTRELSIKPKGFPLEQASGGLLTANGKGTFALTLAPDTVPGSVTTRIAIYPSPVGSLSSALKKMVAEPSGCFEQTSSTVYPMTMALQYFNTHTGSDPAVVKDAQEKLERGTQRLVGFECKEKGYEWFGQDPGHEALTAYGLLEFTDMSKVRSIDSAMLSRTKEWLLKQRDGKGGWERKRRALHTWIEDKDTSDAYITWAVLESGEKNVPAEVKHVKELGLASTNTYVIAVAANVTQLAGDTATAKVLLGKLAERQDPATGMVRGGTQSIVGSTGTSLAIETTAFATLAWLRAGDAFVGATEKAIKGLSEASKDGSYGATQSTVLALKAVLEYDRLRSTGRKPGSVRLFVDGKPLGAAVKYDGSVQGALELPDASELLTAGAHTLELRQDGGGQLPYSMSVSSHRVTPESAPQTQVSLEVALSKPALNEGDVVEATARVTNLTDTQLPTVVAIVGVPGGLEPRIDQLKELVKAKTIDAYEVMGRDVVLYWRGMTPKQQLRVPISLVAAVPGKYVGPASRAYLYYGNEHKTWVAGLTADVAAKAQ